MRVSGYFIFWYEKYFELKIRHNLYSIITNSLLSCQCENQQEMQCICFVVLFSLRGPKLDRDATENGYEVVFLDILS